MTIEYDAESDSLYIRLREGEYAESEEIYPGFVIDFDPSGRPLALDIDDAKSFVDVESLMNAGATSLPRVDRSAVAAKKR